VRAYRSTAAQRAARLGPRHRRERAAGAVGYRPRSQSPAVRYQYTDTTPPRVALPPRSCDRNSRHQRAAQHRRHGDADAFQRPANRQPNPCGGEPGLGAREALRVSNRASCSRRHYLHGLSARCRHRRGSAQQRPRSRADAEQTRDRFNVGEVTRTDVANRRAQLAAGKTQL